MNIFEFSEEFHISLAKSRKIEKRFPHIFDDPGSATEHIRATIANGDNLTTMQLVSLIENPSWAPSLGKYAGAAQKALAALKDPQSQSAPREVVANLMEAAKGEPEAVQLLVDWLRSIIPQREPVGHSYISTRLVLGIPATIRKSEAARIGRALLNARKHPDFAGYWHLEKGVKRNKTLYQNKSFDL